MGKGSVIEAGAIVHSSCRLIVCDNCTIRAGAVLRDEVVMGDGCIVGVNCEVVRCLLLGPDTHIGHFVFVGDSILGRESLLSGTGSRTPRPPGAARSTCTCTDRRSIPAAAIWCAAGDGARIGASTTICAGCVVLPRLLLPPSVTLHGTIDGSRAIA